jgi:tRNA A-37 threonylcarbamoyl transferase component Bud32/tetratricopeptide (TPR) repeat protein
VPQFVEGEVFARYRIEGLLGQGGMGEVYRAYDVLLRRHIALKVVRPSEVVATDEANPEEAAARILREARAAAGLSHRSAVAIFDVGEVDGTPFIAMELVLGRTLRTYVGNPDAPIDQKLRWLVEVARVLAAAHESGLIHRDIKPENVMVSRDGAIKVLDFGIARRAEGSGPPSSVQAPGSDGPRQPPSFRTAAGRLRGTPRYMAPEQLDGARLDGRSDQYGWGVVAYELLSGAHPASRFEGDADPRWTPPPKLLNEVAPGIPFKVAAAIDKALARLPEMRHAGMEDLAKVIEPFAAPVGGASAPGVDQLGLSAAALDPTETGPTVPMPVARQDAPTAEDPRSPPREAARRDMPWRWIAALSLIAISSGAWLLWGARTRVVRGTDLGASSAASTVLPAVEGPPLVLIMGFENRTTDPVFDGAPELILESSLKRSPIVYPFAGAGVRALVAEYAPKTTPSDEELGRIILERTARPVTLVRGTVASVGAGYALSFRAVDARSNAEIAASTLTAETPDRVVPTLARFAAAIRTALGDTVPPGDLEKSGMSRSIEADHEFVMGRGDLSTGKNALAIAHLERAVQIDPDFALAQTGLGNALLNAGRASEGAAHSLAAITTRSDVSQREQLQAEGLYHVARGEFGDAIAAYEKLLSRWPADTRYAGSLAGAYYDKGDFARAHDLAIKTMAEHPSVILEGNLVGIELVMGDFEQARTRAREGLTQFAHPLPLIYAYGALAVAMLGRGDEVAFFHRRLEEADASAAAAVEGDFAAFEGRLPQAAALLEAGISSDEARRAAEDAASKWATLAEVRLRQGNAATARAAATHAAASTEVVTLFRAARVLVGASRLEEAKALADRISGFPGDRAQLFTLLLDAEMQRARGAGARAVTGLEAARGAADAWIVHAELGEAELALGAFADAERELDICRARRGEGLTAFLDDAVTARYLPPVLYELARAKDSLHRSDAVDAYKAFLAIDSGADDPLVRDARRRIEGH